MYRKVASAILFCLLYAVPALAAEGGAAAAGQQLSQPEFVQFFCWSVITAGFALGLVAVAASFGQGMAVKSAVEGIARQPEAAPKIQMALMIGLAFIESLVLYSLFIAIILLFVNPFLKLFVK
jgi:F-type H+-transporting ATPase subunit c